MDNEWSLIDLQGDLDVRNDKDKLKNNFIGDLHFKKVKFLKAFLKDTA